MTEVENLIRQKEFEQISLSTMRVLVKDVGTLKFVSGT